MPHNNPQTESECTHSPPEVPKSLYYCPQLDQFLVFEGIMHSPYRTTNSSRVRTIRGMKNVQFSHDKLSGDRWLRVCESTLTETAGKIESVVASQAVSDAQVHRAVMQYYRLRQCMETEGASEGFDFLFDWSAQKR